VNICSRFTHLIKAFADVFRHFESSLILFKYMYYAHHIFLAHVSHDERKRMANNTFSLYC